jgi:hypothetical protein
MPGRDATGFAAVVGGTVAGGALVGGTVVGGTVVGGTVVGGTVVGGTVVGGTVVGGTVVGVVVTGARVIDVVALRRASPASADDPQALTVIVTSTVHKAATTPTGDDALSRTRSPVASAGRVMSTHLLGPGRGGASFPLRDGESGAGPFGPERSVVTRDVERRVDGCA